MLGQQLYNGTISSTKETVNTSQSPAGDYILHLTDAAGQRKKHQTDKRLNHAAHLTNKTFRSRIPKFSLHLILDI
jgi:hypothetical protein